MYIVQGPGKTLFFPTPKKLLQIWGSTQFGTFQKLLHMFYGWSSLISMERKLQIVSFPRSETGSYGVEIVKHAFAIHKWLSGVLKFSQFSVHFKITSSEGELIHLTQGKPSARKVVRDHTRLPEISVGSQGDGRHCVKV